MVTIEQVARHAGVSVATVSRTLNNSPTVKTDTAKRVLEAVEALNYTPNQSARNLRKNESKVILALAPNFSNPYYSSILNGIGDKAREWGYSVLICNSSGDAHSEQHFLKMLETRRADGAILLGCHKDYLWLSRYSERFPIVLCCEYVPDIECCSVAIDNYMASCETVSFLLAHGHKSIAMIGADNDYISTQLRRKGYFDTMEKAGLPAPSAYYCMADADYSFVSGQAAAKKLLSLEPRPTAVFCVSDILALSVISVAQEMGLSVPGELTVTGFDDVVYTTMFHPYLTTVSQPCYEMGTLSVDLILELVRGDRTTGIHYVPHRLVERESSDYFIQKTDSNT